MKNHWIIIRIVLSLVVIFVLGIWVGRMTSSHVSVEPLQISIEKGDSKEEVEIKKTTLRSLTKYRTHLRLTKDQVRTLRPEFSKVTRRMYFLPKLSKARLAVLEEFHEELQKHLSEEQREKLKELMKQAIAKDRT